MTDYSKWDAVNYDTDEAYSWVSYFDSDNPGLSVNTVICNTLQLYDEYHHV